MAFSCVLDLLTSPLTPHLSPLTPLLSPLPPLLSPPTPLPPHPSPLTSHLSPPSPRTPLPLAPNEVRDKQNLYRAGLAPLPNRTFLARHRHSLYRQQRSLEASSAFECDVGSRGSGFAMAFR